jgi:predicted DNA binding CopG/RHH family protein
MGRPKLPKGETKGQIVPVRFSASEVARISAAANANGMKISEWIRSTLNAATT